MTLTARVKVGEDPGTAVDFPEQGFGVEPDTLGRAALQLLREDHSVNMQYVYPHIGFDAASARQHLKALAEEERRAGAGPDSEFRTSVKKFRITSKAIGLELIAGLFLSVLDSPEETHCPCRAHIVGQKAVPYSWAQQGNPDVRADYRDFAILAEVTTIRRFTMEDVDRQWKGACTHAVAVTDRPRVYCLMVNRLGLALTDKREREEQAAQHRRHLAKLRNAPELLSEAANEAAQKARQAGVEEDAEREPPDVKFLLLHIEDMAQIASRLHALYCGSRRRARELTEDVLGAVLDDVHTKMMEHLATKGEFPKGWASTTFKKLLDDHVVKKQEPAGDEAAA